MKQLDFFVLLSGLLFLFFSCQTIESEVIEDIYSQEELSLLSESLDLPSTPFNYEFSNVRLDDKVNHKATFGRVLFYDKNLSADGTVSCSSCHQQELAFADNKVSSIGPNGNVTARNSIALGALESFGGHYAQLPGNNLRRAKLFWDERATTVKEQLEQTINNPNEMGMDVADIAEMAEEKDYYRILNKKAFQSDRITKDHILEALEAFINSIGSQNSEFDLKRSSEWNYINGDSIINISDDNLGFKLFVDHCSGCHGNSLNLFRFNDQNSTELFVANNGLPLRHGDLGVYDHSGKSKDIGKFKIPGLRNIELTAPYMHDGRFETLEEVVEFYNSGIEYSENLHPSLRLRDGAKRLGLSEEEKTALVDFLKMQTDHKMTEVEKWSNPFLE